MILIEHQTTADMDDGQVLPPLIENGIVWCVVRRAHGFTLWRRLSLLPLRAPISPPTARVPHGGTANGNKQ
jgi:hypothetical protein